MSDINTVATTRGNQGECPICGESMNGGKIPDHMVKHVRGDEP